MKTSPRVGQRPLSNKLDGPTQSQHQGPLPLACWLMRAKTLPSLGFSNLCFPFSPLCKSKGEKPIHGPNYQHTRPLGLTGTPGGVREGRCPASRWVATGSKGLRDTQAFLLLTPRLHDARPGHCSPGGSWGWNPPTIHPVPFTKCPEGQNTESLAWDQTFYAKSLDRKGP